MDVIRDEVDGVATVSVGENAFPGALRAGLIFGVGRSDECLQNSGITHAVEHLVLQSIGKTLFPWNGSVGLASTSFYATGEPGQVVEFLLHVAAQLREPPVGRLEQELRVLAVEGQRHNGHQLNLDLSVRFGPRGVGLVAWPEHGLGGLRADDIVEWARTWFRASNAALLMTGPLPAGLDLTRLPQGDPAARQPAPSMTDGPVFVGAPTRTTSVSMLSDDERWGLIPSMAIARDRAFERLRRRDALSYAIEYVHVRLRGPAVDYLSADGTDDSQQQVFDGLIGILEELSEEGPTEEELEMARQARARTAGDADRIPVSLDAWCERRLLGLPTVSPDESMARLDAQSVESCRNDLKAAMATMLAIGAEEIGEPQSWTRHSDWSPVVIGGSSYEPIEGRETGALLVGPEGLSFVRDDMHGRSVRWDEAVGCLAWTYGVRTVIGPRGEGVVVIPWNWQAGSGLPSIVDSHIPPERRIDMGEEEIRRQVDPDDAASVVDERWLASVVGVFCQQQRADLVVDTDGLFILFRTAGADDVSPRLQALRYVGRVSLLGENERNRWIPEEDIVEVRVSKRPLARLAAVKATVHVKTASDHFKVDLMSDTQLHLAATWLPQAVGRKFLS